ncbi:hypothetical protein [Candidatus Finniella inopinata]|uniref:Uncharacterized protein n=1 Tax=Candidatus Finniella inopinata TaxID=1696036 RepID=A0A4Q7DK09_9PROT|nr:hypothetical protein [Candidatus Finniella inopinata]RZI46515.1 hypothetical protein EQU50_02715 [Candidatus Finniella inopinata]
MNKMLKKFFVFVCFLGGVYAQATTLESEIVDEYSTFRINLMQNRVNQPCSAVQFIRHLQENAEIYDNAAKKIALIIGSGAGVGGISDREATPEERALILEGINFAVEQGIQEAGFNLELKGFDDHIGKHQTVVARLIEAAKAGQNLVQNNLLNSLRVPRDNSNASAGGTAIQPPGGACAGVQYQVEEEQPGAQSSSQPPQHIAPAAPAVVQPCAWSSLNAPALSDIYNQTYNKPLLNGHRVYATQRFPINLVTRPGGWDELVRICAAGRLTSNLSKECVQDYSEVCFDIADQLGWISAGGKDSSDAGRQARHIVSKMGLGLNTGIRLFNNLGYPLKEKTQRKGFKSNQIADFD